MNEPENFIDIDLNRLEWQWAEQPKLRRYYGREFAKAKKQAAIAKNNVKVALAELRLATRREMAEENEKITVDAVEDRAICSPKYQKVIKEQIEADFAVDMLEATVKALDHRKDALQDEVRLWLGEYFATPIAPDNARDQLRKVEAESSMRKVNSKIKGRRAEDDD